MTAIRIANKALLVRPCIRSSTVRISIISGRASTALLVANRVRTAPFAVRKAPLAGLLVVLAIFDPGLDGEFVRIDSIPISFYLGALAAVKKWDLQRWDPYAVPIGFVLLLVCAGVVLLDMGRPVWLAVVAPFLVWPLASKFVGTRPGHWFVRQGQAAIFLFMFHGVVLIFLKRAFPHYQKGEFEFLVWLVSPILITILSHQVYLLLRKHLPGLLALLLGGRKPVQIDGGN